MIDRSCRKFIFSLSSAEPVPGGGGASALGGALAAALGCMVGNLTKGKKKYASVQEDIELLTQELEEIQEKMMKFVQADAEAFLPLSKAYGLKGETDAEKAHKLYTLELALREACSVPMQIMEEGAKAVHLLQKMGEKGTRLAVSDVGVGAVLLKAAVQGAAMNVYTNTKLMKDRTYAEVCDKKADSLRQIVEKEADEIYKLVEEELRCQS